MSLNASVREGNLNLYPAATSFSGMTRCPSKIIVEDSPMAIFITKLGTLNRQGRLSAFASDFENSLLVAGSGAVRLNAPLHALLLSKNEIP